FDNHSYVWVVTGVGTLQNSNLNNATILWADTGVASIKVTASNAECGSDTFTQAVQVAPAVGLNEANGLSGVTLYPNPTVGEVFVTGNTTQKQVLVQVFNNTLQLVYSQTVEAAQGNINTSFNTTHLSNGLYFVKIGNGSKYGVYKLVVLK
ncbi:MAG: T9SS C-terminal target domain-containing protein, partial [Bacteroidetes bacterium]